MWFNNNVDNIVRILNKSFNSLGKLSVDLLEESEEKEILGHYYLDEAKALELESKRALKLAFKLGKLLDKY